MNKLLDNLRPSPKVCNIFRPFLKVFHIFRPFLNVSNIFGYSVSNYFRPQQEKLPSFISDLHKQINFFLCQSSDFSSTPDFSSNSFCSVISPIFTFDETRFTSDKFRMFKYAMFAANGTDYTGLGATRHLCLGSQASVDHLFSLVEIVKRWSGPISLSLFVPDVEFGISQVYIQYLRKCIPAIQSQVS